MYLQQNSEICVLHAISPVHAGAGSATGAVDLPIQRERHSGWPHIQASGVKGAFRDHCERVWMLQDLEIDKLVTDEKKKRAIELAKRVFGQSGENISQAGAVAFSEARLLAFPVRSNLAPFVWVVCPTLLKRLARDLNLIGEEGGSLSESTIPVDSYASIKGGISDTIVLEDVCLNHDKDNQTGKTAAIFSKLAPAVERLVLIPDNHFSFLMETATEIQAQIKIDSATGTTETGSLRYQELLPADSILYTLVFWGDERAADTDLIVLDALRKAVKKAASSHIQIGGDLTLGRGIFELAWHKGGAV